MKFKNFWYNADNFIQTHFKDVLGDLDNITFISCFGKYEDNDDSLKIFYTGENNNTNKEYCKYSLSFEPDSETNLQYPLWGLSTDRLKKKSTTPKTKFCSFIISNDDPKYRIEIFKYISTHYKQIDSIGQKLNNTGFVQPFDNYESSYKFNLCFENSQSEYYITEKIINAYAYNSIPIYWGGNAERYFNPKSFINCNGLTKEEILNKIIEVDTNDNLYNEMINTPPFKGDYLEYFHNKLKNFIYKKRGTD